MGDLNPIQGRICALRQRLFADGISLGLPFVDKDLQTIVERLRSEGASFYKVTLPLLGRALDKGLVSGQFTCPAHFATKRNTRLPKWGYAVFRRIFSDEGILLDNPDPISIYFTRQILLLDSKLVFEPTPEQKKSALQGFRDRQRTLRRVRIPHDHPVLLRAQWLLGVVLRRLDLSNISPGHGPGAVAEKKSHEERWDFTSWPAKAERCYPYGVYGTHGLRASLERGIGVPLVKNLTTRCCLVPKDFRGPRLISAEPTVNQYLQQGQMKAITQYVEHHPVLSRSLRFNDQTLNQRTAQVAAERGLITLDLSDASDLVSTTLVWYLLSKVPRLRRQLMSTRSDSISLDGDVEKIVAFAPMGSAVCFPVESLVFWSLSMASMMLSDPSPANSRRSLRELASSLCVFGDDIIIPDYAFDTLCGTLTSVGCRVNMSKTCYATPFRESCGTEWYRTHDVSIIRNRRYYYEASGKFSDYLVLLGLQRKFFVRGCYRTAEVLEEWAREIYPVVKLSTTLLTRPGNCGDVDRRGLRSTAVGLERSALSSHLRGSDVESGLRCAGSSARDSDRLVSIMSGLLGFPCYSGDPESYFIRQAFGIDQFPCALGHYTHLDDGVRLRYNRNYQRVEFRVPREFSTSKDWLSGGYARLLARLSSDRTERIANRDLRVKLAWSYLPGHYDFHRNARVM